MIFLPGKLVKEDGKRLSRSRRIALGMLPDLPGLGVDQGIHGIDNQPGYPGTRIPEYLIEDGTKKGQGLPRTRARGHHKTPARTAKPESFLLVLVQGIPLEHRRHPW